MAVGEAVLGRHGGFGSGLKFRCFERIDIDDVGCRGVGRCWTAEIPAHWSQKEGKKEVCVMG